MLRKITDFKYDNKVTLVRVDFNVPLKNGIITDDVRIKAALPTIKYLIEKGAKIILFSHFGRVKQAEDLKSKTLAPVASLLSKLLGDYLVQFINDIEGGVLEAAVANLKSKEIILVENTRFADLTDSNGQLNLKANRESGNNPSLGKYWASLGEIFINDAFGTAHRAHASNVGIATNMKNAGVGFLMQQEVQQLSKIIDHPEQPFISIIGGAKVSDKIEVIENFLKIADYIVIGGAMAFTFMAAKGKEIGASIYEADKVDLAANYMAEYGDKIILPIDFAESMKFENSEPVYTTDENITPKYMGLDIGPQSIEKFAKIVAQAKTIFWNGPFGVFEFSHYATSTIEICKALAALKGAFKVIGGGDSAAAAEQLGFAKAFDHISTGGGAALDFVAGKVLPGINCLEDK